METDKANVFICVKKSYKIYKKRKKHTSILYLALK